MFRTFAAALSGIALVVSSSQAEEKMPVELKVVVKKESIAWPYQQKPKEFEKKLMEIAKEKEPRYPTPPSLEMVLQFTNTTKEKVTVYLEGDANVLTFTLKGPGVTTAKPLLAFTSDFRLPKPIEIEPGKSYEIFLRSLTDGFRNASRYIYPLAPGEYTLSATYQLTTEDGAKAGLLKSGEAKFKIDEPK